MTNPALDDVRRYAIEFTILHKTLGFSRVTQSEKCEFSLHQNSSGDRAAGARDEINYAD
jgi:hypothetical protein